MGWSNLVFLAGSIALGIFYKIRGKSLDRLTAEAFPELSALEFEAVRENLAVSNQRMLALAVALLLLAVNPLFGYGPLFENTVMTITVVLFFYNIPPRNRAMRIIFERGVERERFRSLGVWL